jgi:CheY-like chemotaxis protein
VAPTQDEAVSPTTVLVADDDDEFRSLVVEALQSEGYHVFEARDGGELLSLLADIMDDPATRPDVVVADVRMPSLSGLGVLAELKRARVNVPVVIMTGFAPASVELVAKRLGATGFLKKPFDLDSLQTAVKRARVR